MKKLVGFLLAVIAVLISILGIIESDAGCSCAAINTECGTGTYSSIREWEKTLETEATDAERTALSSVIDGEGV